MITKPDAIGTSSSIELAAAAAMRRLRAWITRAANKHVREMAEANRQSSIPGV